MSTTGGASLLCAVWLMRLLLFGDKHTPPVVARAPDAGEVLNLYERTGRYSPHPYCRCPSPGWAPAGWAPALSLKGRGGAHPRRSTGVLLSPPRERSQG